MFLVIVEVEFCLVDSDRSDGYASALTSKWSVLNRKAE